MAFAAKRLRNLQKVTHLIRKALLVVTLVVGFRFSKKALGFDFEWAFLVLVDLDFYLAAFEIHESFRGKIHRNLFFFHHHVAEPSLHPCVPIDDHVGLLHVPIGWESLSQILVAPVLWEVVDEQAGLLNLIGARASAFVGGVRLDNELAVVFGDCADPHELLHVLTCVEIQKGVLGHWYLPFFGDGETRDALRVLRKKIE